MMKAISKHSNSGFSLMEIMISLGLVGVMSLGIMKTSEKTSQMQKKARVETDSMVLSNAFRYALENKGTCEDILVGKKAGDSNIKVNDGGVVIKTITQLAELADDRRAFKLDLYHAASQTTRPATVMTIAPGGVIAECLVADDSTTSIGTIDEMCLTMGGAMVEGECDLRNVFTGQIIPTVCESLGGKEVDGKCEGLTQIATKGDESVCVNVSGENICPELEYKDSNFFCPDGEYMQGLSAKMTAICKKIPEVVTVVDDPPDVTCVKKDAELTAWEIQKQTECNKACGTGTKVLVSTRACTGASECGNNKCEKDGVPEPLMKIESIKCNTFACPLDYDGPVVTDSEGEDSSVDKPDVVDNGLTKSCSCSRQFSISDGSFGTYGYYSSMNRCRCREGSYTVHQSTAGYMSELSSKISSYTDQCEKILSGEVESEFGSSDECILFDDLPGILANGSDLSTFSSSSTLLKADICPIGTPYFYNFNGSTFFMAMPVETMYGPTYMEDYGIYYDYEAEANGSITANYKCI